MGTVNIGKTVPIVAVMRIPSERDDKIILSTSGRLRPNGMMQPRRRHQRRVLAAKEAFPLKVDMIKVHPNGNSSCS